MFVSTNFLRPGECLGRYRIRRMLGYGGHSCVYLAEDMLAERLVAIKVSPYSSVLLDEGWLLSRLDHPMIPKLTDIVRTETGAICLVLEYFEGITLEEFLYGYPHGEFPLDTAIEIGSQLTQVLKYLHTHQLVIAHSDIKPGNVMLTMDCQVKLIDFGTASWALGEHRRSRQTGIGTLGYMAPEVCKGLATTALSDMYSFGVMLHHMLTGDEVVSEGTLQPLRSVDGPLGSLITRMISVNPQERPQQIQEVYAVLSSLPSTQRAHTIMDEGRIGA